MQVNSLNFHYRNKDYIINDLSLKFKKHAITTIIGPNGCGKSTLLELISKNLKPTSGTIYLNHKDLKSYSKKLLAHTLATVHQKMNAPEDFTVKQFIELGRYSHSKMFKKDNKKTEAIHFAMKVLDLDKFQDQPVNTLSGGELQRVFLATALAQESEYILLDEPTTFLDIHYQYQILDTIKQINNDLNVTMIMVLHDINQAIQYSDELICLGKERVLAQGPPHQIINELLIKQMYHMNSKIIFDEECGMMVCRKRNEI